MPDRFTSLEEKLGVTFRNRKILAEALTHRSYLNENASWPVGHNERLEFLGDAVLELIVSEYLFGAFPHKEEGELTALRAVLVNTRHLETIARELGFNDYIQLSRGQARDTPRAWTFILGSALEAVIGAMYFDQGYEVTRSFVLRTLIRRLPELLAQGLDRDSKSFFQERAQELVGITPTYEVLEEWGPDHRRYFVVGVYLGDELVAKGEGLSKREAERNAAAAALVAKGWSVAGPADIGVRQNANARQGK